MPSPGRGAPVVTGEPRGSFAWGVLHERHPALVARVRGATPYPPPQQRALDALLAETAEGGTVAPLDDAEPGAAQWARWGEGHVGRPWAQVPFLWAESFFYRRLLAALGYFTPGTWQGVDPFAPFKRAELAAGKVGEELAALERLPDLAPEERDAAVLLSSLWGNRADLGFRLSAGEGGERGEGERVPGLVADDSAALWEVLDGGPPGTVCLVADNAGSELLPDLVLADHLLRTGRAADVVLHLKPYPYFVSDATTRDALACLERMAAAAGRARELGRRLREAIGGGRLVLRAHPFSCAPLPYPEMPADLRADFAAATLTVMKGDLNYRRLVQDRHWPATTPFAEVTGYFPGPVAALRTLKSDVVTGLGRQTEDALDATGAAWRTSGTHALVQVRR